MVAEILHNIFNRPMMMWTMPDVICFVAITMLAYVLAAKLGNRQ